MLLRGTEGGVPCKEGTQGEVLGQQGSNASPPGAGGGEHILLLGRGSSLRVDSQKEALDQGSEDEDAEYPEPECWLPICSVTLGRRWSRLANFSQIAMQMQRAHVGDG